MQLDKLNTWQKVAILDSILQAGTVSHTESEKENGWQEIWEYYNDIL